MLLFCWNTFVCFGHLTCKDILNDRLFVLKQIFIICRTYLPCKMAAVRILAFYCRTLSPSRELILIVKYIQMVYGTSWFAIKKSRDFRDGPKLIFQMIQAIDHMNEKDIKRIALPVIQRNCFCLQPGNFLAVPLYSEEENHRALDVKKILESRTNPVLIPRHGEKDDMRINVIPTINLNSQELIFNAY